MSTAVTPTLDNRRAKRRDRPVGQALYLARYRMESRLRRQGQAMHFYQRGVGLLLDEKTRRWCKVHEQGEAGVGLVPGVEQQEAAGLALGTQTFTDTLGGTRQQFGQGHDPAGSMSAALSSIGTKFSSPAASTVRKTRADAARRAPPAVRHLRGHLALQTLHQLLPCRRGRITTASPSGAAG